MKNLKLDKALGIYCEHEWKHNEKGYVEHCIPAICTKCGIKGCFCDARRDGEEKGLHEGEIRRRFHKGTRGSYEDPI